MNYMPGVVPKFEYVSVNEIEFRPGSYNVRVTGIKEELDELKENISQFGILEPVILLRSDGKYIVLAGQRRVAAAKEAGIDKVPAVVYEGLTELQALEISFINTLLRKEVGRADLIEAASKFFRYYGCSVKAAAEKLKMKEWRLRNLLKAKTLPDEIQRDEEIPDRLLAPLSKLVRDETKDKPLVLATASKLKELKKSYGTEDLPKFIKAVDDARRRLGDAPVDQVVKAGTESFIREMEEERTAPRQLKEIPENALLILAPPETHEALERAASDSGMTKSDLALEIIHEWLYEKGYLKAPS